MGLLMGRSIFGFVFLMLVAFDPQVPFFPNGVGFTSVVSCLLFLPFIHKSLSFNGARIVRAFAPLFVYFIVVFVAVIVRVLANDGGNVEIFLSWIKALLVLTSVFFYCVVFWSDRLDEGSGTQFIRIVMAVFVFNAFVNFIAGSFPEYFEILKPFRSEVVSDSLGKNPYRNSFISGSGYFSIGTAYGLIVLLGTYALVRLRPNGLLQAFGLVFIAMAGFIAARTSFFAIVLAAGYIFLYRPLYLIPLSVLVFGGVIMLLLLPALEPYLAWMQSFFSEFDSSSSADYLINQMYFWPGWEIFAFGRGAANDGLFNYTDSGYMQDMLFGGVFFAALKFSITFLVVIKILRFSILFALIVLVAVMIFQFKGLFVYNNAQGMAALYLLYFYFSVLVPFGTRAKGHDLTCERALNTGDA